LMKRQLNAESQSIIAVNEGEVPKAAEEGDEAYRRSEHQAVI
jgi:hypothetical protein